MKKKYLSLFLALIMILGVIPTSIFAETGTQKYKITFIASKDVGNRDYGIEGIDGKESVSVDANVYHNFKNKDYELSYYIDGKKVDGINPTNNTTVYVGVSGWGKNYYPEEEIEKKPNGYVTVTFNSGEHGKFVGYKGSGSVSERKFYVPKFKEVDLSHAVYFVDIDKGWVDKGYDSLQKKIPLTKTLREPLQVILALMLNMKKKTLHISLLKLIIKRLQKLFLLNLYMAT